MRRLRDGTCPQGRSSGTIHDTSAYEHGQNLMRDATIKAHKKPVEERREREREKERRGEPREIAQNDFTSRCRDVLYLRKKITALESDPRLWKLFAATLLPFSSLAPPSAISSLGDLPRSVLAGKLCARSCEIPLIRDTAASHAQSRRDARNFGAVNEFN